MQPRAAAEPHPHGAEGEPERPRRDEDGAPLLARLARRVGGLEVQSEDDEGGPPELQEEGPKSSSTQ